jgi:hypothetical protein
MSGRRTADNSPDPVCETLRQLDMGGLEMMRLLSRGQGSSRMENSDATSSFYGSTAILRHGCVEEQFRAGVQESLRKGRALLSFDVESRRVQDGRVVSAGGGRG